jgi:hypothetical protein
LVKSWQWNHDGQSEQIAQKKGTAANRKIKIWMWKCRCRISGVYATRKNARHDLKAVKAGFRDQGKLINPWGAEIPEIGDFERFPPAVRQVKWN